MRIIKCYSFTHEGISGNKYSINNHSALYLNKLSDAL